MPRKLKIKRSPKRRYRREPRNAKFLDPSHVHPEPTVKKEKRIIWPRPEPKGWRWVLLSHTSPSGKMMHACNLCGNVTATPDKWEYHGPRCNETCNPMVKTIKPFQEDDGALIAFYPMKDPIIFRSEAQLEGIKKDAETAARRRFTTSIYTTAKQLEALKKRLPSHLKKDHIRLRHHISALYLLWSDLMRQEATLEEQSAQKSSESPAVFKSGMLSQPEIRYMTPPPKPSCEKTIPQDHLRPQDYSRFDEAQMEFHPHR